MWRPYFFDGKVKGTTQLPASLSMHNEFTAVIERDGDWYIAYCPEVPGANGQGTTKQEAVTSLRDAIALILEDRREDGLRGVPADAERDVVVIE
jgi:predicted RNase H-like HicB family nuclease